MAGRRPSLTSRWSAGAAGNVPMVRPVLVGFEFTSHAALLVHALCGGHWWMALVHGILLVTWLSGRHK